MHVHACLSVCTGVSTPTISAVQQLSRSVIRLALLSVQSDDCLTGYTVTARAGGGPTTHYTTVASSSTLDATGLDTCRYNYSFVASAFTRGSVMSEESDPVSLVADLSGEIVTHNKL